MADVKQYRQTATVHAEQLDAPYAAYSGRGLQQGNPGDYLCYREGAEADKYTLERAIFEDTHEEIPQETPAPAPVELAPATTAETAPATGAAPTEVPTATPIGAPTETAPAAPSEAPVTQEPLPDLTTGPAVTEGPQTTATATTTP